MKPKFGRKIGDSRLTTLVQVVVLIHGNTHPDLLFPCVPGFVHAGTLSILGRSPPHPCRAIHGDREIQVIVVSIDYDDQIQGENLNASVLEGLRNYDMFPRTCFVATHK